MSNIHKRFDLELYRQNDVPARDAVLSYLISRGSYVVYNPDQYGPDLILYSGYRPISYVEVEIKRVWRADQEQFPWSTVQLPARKKKFATGKMHCDFWILREDLKCALVISDVLLVDERLAMVPNRYVAEGEFFYQIPITECSLITIGV